MPPLKKYSGFQPGVLLFGEVEPDAAAARFYGMVERLAMLECLVGGEAIVQLADLRGVAETEGSV
jgi:hypothetical protein